MDILAKYVRVSKLLERRILHGDYLLKDFPTDRELSAEFQVDTRTARRAVASLIDAGLLFRQRNGRPAVVTTGWRERGQLRLALLSVAYPSPYTWRWQRAIERLTQHHGWLFRPVTYTHLDDPVVADTLEGFDGVFFGLPGIDPTDHLLRTVQRSGRPVVFLDADVSAHGFPSLWLASPTFITRLLDHLREQGHRRVACLNTQPHNAVTDIRISGWREWASCYDAAGPLIDCPVESFESPVDRAYHAANQVLDHGGFEATSLLCCTSAAAKGVYRALHEHGMEAGRDLAICSADDGAGEAPYFIPSLTSIQDPAPEAYLSPCIEWIERGGQDWKGPLLVQPRDVPLFLGESTRRS
jgi:DNA-binding LacI/PurR family transcriptional regulator